MKTGIIGYGYMGKFHYNKMMKMEGMQPYAVFDISEERRQEAKRNQLQVYDSFKAFINDGGIELVAICTPNDAHFQYALEALKHGKHVLCEKPATLSVAELKKLIQCASANKRIFTTHQNRRWDKDFKVVKEALEKGMIGQPTTILSQTHGQRGVCFGWRAIPENGGGMLYDWGIHLVDQILMLFPEQKVISVYARLRSILTPLVDDYFELELEFDNDCVAHIRVSTFALQELPRWYVFGDKGTLKLDDFSGEKGGIARIKGDVKGFERVNSQMGPSRTMAHLEMENLETLTLPKAQDTPDDFYANLIKAIRREEEIEVKPAQMLRAMQIIEAAFLSGKENRKIDGSI